MNPGNQKALRNLVRYALLASLATLMQVSAGFFPGPGHVIGAFNTLPVALAAYISPLGGFFCYLVSGWLTFSIMPSEMPILTLCTAPLGLALGTGMHFDAKKLFTILGGSILLTGGMVILTTLLGIHPFSKILTGQGFTVVLVMYFVFSLVYSYSWYHFARRIVYQMQSLGFTLK